MWSEILAIALGFVVLTWSADRFVVGAAAVARNLRVSPLIIGLTIVSLGTSAPEILVAVIASFEGNTGLAVGNAIGSNIINIALVLGITALILPLDIHSSIVRRELPILILIVILAYLLIADGTLGRTDGYILLGGLILMLAWLTGYGMTSKAASDPMAAEYQEELSTPLVMSRAILWLVVGVVFLLLSSRLLVWGAVGIAQDMGVSELVIGLTIVALGTSLPELAASFMSALKKEHDIAIGNIIGSNMYNLLAVLAVPGIIHPGGIDAEVLTRDFPVMFALTLVLFLMAYGFRGPGRINRVEGGLLLLAFCGYQTLLYFTEVGINA